MAIDSSFIGQTIIGTGSQVAPVAGTQIAGVTAPAKGYWRIVIKYGYGATAEATNVNNFFISINGAQYLANTLPSPLGVVNTMFEFVLERVFLNGANNVSVAPNNNASAGAVYIAGLAMTPYQN